MKENNFKPDNKPDNCQLVIFGGTGDLTHRKLIPALYNLQLRELMPDNSTIVAVGRRDKTDEIYRREVEEAVKKFSRLAVKDETWQLLRSHIYYLQFDFRDNKGYTELQEFLNNGGNQAQTVTNRIFYLAVAPEYFAVIVDKLKEHQLLDSDQSSQNRVVIEKPFGHDLKTARQLNRRLTAVFPEKSIYRIDHYLGKEMLQNITVIRFANALFEPLWNNRYIDHVQIISSEMGGVGTRGGYYEKSGALRDMVQNHLLQLLTLTAMEPPANLETESIRNEKVKVLKSLKKINPDLIDNFAVRGQYGPGTIDGRQVAGYRQEERVDQDSNTETFAALKLNINNLRWDGVPFYIKTGKRLKEKSTEIIIQFNSFPHPAYRDNFKYLEPNLLIIRIQPLEGVYLQFNAKQPGTRRQIVPVRMDFCQNCQIGSNSPEAYERLLYDVMRGDQTLFTRWDEVEYSWKFIDNIAAAWKKVKPDFPNYPANSSGPTAADRLLERDRRRWWQFEEGRLTLQAGRIGNENL